MSLPFYFFLPLLIFFIHATAHPGRDQPFVQELHRFPNGTRVENICVLHNGSLLFTVLTEPSLYLLDPESPSAPVLVQSIPAHTSVLGIAQLDPHTVAVVAGNLSGYTLDSTLGSYSVFLLALSNWRPPRIVASFAIPGSSLLDGLTTLPLSPQHLLIADAALGVVWRLNILTGAVDQPISDPLFTKNAGNPVPALNGIHALGEYLYFSNSNKALLGRIRITADGSPVGEPAKVLAYDLAGATYDDFNILPDRTVFIASVTGNSINRITPDGSQKVVVGSANDTQIDHPTAVAFAKKSGSRRIIYVTTAGFLPGYGGVGGGQVLKVDLGRRGP